MNCLKWVGIVLAFRAIFLSGEVCAQESKPIFAVIYYQVDDKAFERAANTLKTELAGSFDPLLIGVKTKQDFLDAWKKIATTATAKKAKVAEVHLLTHASKQTDGQDGLEFAGPAGGGTLAQNEISKLSKLPWSDAKIARLRLYGCNTGLEGDRKWNPAKEFAKAQGVKSSGESGYAYFSTDPKKYVKITATDKKVYLGAYKRGKNGVAGDGSRMPVVEVDP